MPVIKRRARRKPTTAQLFDVSEFIDLYCSLIDGHYLPSIRTWNAGSLRRHCSEQITNFLVEKEIALPARGPFTARLNQEIDLSSFLKDRFVFDISFSVRSQNEIEKSRWGTKNDFSVSDETSYIYLVSSSNGLTKIGVTNNPLDRFYDLSNMSPVKLDLIYYTPVPSEYVYKMEARLHGLFRSKRQHGEWFRLTGRDILFIKQINIHSDIYEDLSNTRKERARIIRSVLFILVFIAFQIVVFWVLSITLTSL